MLISVPCCHEYLAGTTGYRTFPLITQYGLDRSGCQPTVSKPKHWSFLAVGLSFFWLKLSRLSSPLTGRVEILSTFKEERTSYHIATDHHTITPHMVSCRSQLRCSLSSRQDITASTERGEAERGTLPHPVAIDRPPMGCVPAPA